VVSYAQYSVVRISTVEYSTEVRIIGSFASPVASLAFDLRPLLLTDGPKMRSVQQAKGKVPLAIFNRGVILKAAFPLGNLNLFFYLLLC
jgi:hypothetical protein